MTQQQQEFSIRELAETCAAQISQTPGGDLEIVASMICWGVVGLLLDRMPGLGPDRIKELSEQFVIHFRDRVCEQLMTGPREAETPRTTVH